MIPLKLGNCKHPLGSGTYVTMVMDTMTPYPAGTAECGRQLDYLYKRLATVTNLIRSLEEYDLHRPKPTVVVQEKTA